MTYEELFEPEAIVLVYSRDTRTGTSPTEPD